MLFGDTFLYSIRKNLRQSSRLIVAGKLFQRSLIQLVQDIGYFLSEQPAAKSEP